MYDWLIVLVIVAVVFGLSALIVWLNERAGGC